MHNPDHQAERFFIVGDVGRAGARFALTDTAGVLLQETIRTFEAQEHTTISSALLAFREQVALARLPRRGALAVAGVSRGDTISITGSRWFISKSGLGSILQHPPLILNDFAANAWAVSAARQADIHSISSPVDISKPGTFVVLGTGTGLGVAAFVRDPHGAMTVLPTEAGHSQLHAIPELSPLLASIHAQSRENTAETLLSAKGLVAIYNAICTRDGKPPRASSSEEVIRSAGADPIARQAVMLFCRTLWSFAGNLTLIYGAWDGVLLTGKMANALRSFLVRPDALEAYVFPGPYARLLRDVPAAFLLLTHAELRGAAVALATSIAAEERAPVG